MQKIFLKKIHEISSVVKPVVPITKLIFIFDSILAFSKVDLGLEKSTTTSGLVLYIINLYI